MIPQLYTADQDGYPQQRIGGLSQATQCDVTEEINGEYSLSLTMPIGALHYGDLAQGYAIKARKDEPTTTPATFIIRSVSKTLGDQISVYAVHESYRFNNVMVSPFLNNGDFHNASWAITQVSNNVVNPATGMQIIFELTDTSETAINLVKPCSLRSFLLETLVPMWGGEFVFEPGNIIRWKDQRGLDNGARVVYRGSLVSMQTDQAEQDYETAIYPYYGSAGDDKKPLVEIVGRILDYGMSLAPTAKVIPVDFTGQFESTPSPAKLLEAAQQYKEQHKRATVPTALQIEIAEQEHFVPIQLGDTVTVICGPLGIREKRRVKKLIFDALTERTKSIEVGDNLPTFAATILDN